MLRKKTDALKEHLVSIGVRNVKWIFTHLSVFSIGIVVSHISTFPLWLKAPQTKSCRSCRKFIKSKNPVDSFLLHFYFSLIKKNSIQLFGLFKGKNHPTICQRKCLKESISQNKHFFKSFSLHSINFYKLLTFE